MPEGGYECAIGAELSEEFTAIIKKIKRAEEEMVAYINKEFKEEYELLITIPGISFVTASTILSVIDTVDRFERADQFSSYCGLIPSEHSSGDKVIHGRITKEGSKTLRSALIQSAWAILRVSRSKEDDPRLANMRKKYYRMSMKQKSSKKAITAIARMLSRIVFGVLKHREAYSSSVKNPHEITCNYQMSVN